MKVLRCPHPLALLTNALVVSAFFSCRAPAADEKGLSSFVAHTGYVTALAFSPDGKGLVTGGEDKTVKFWNLATGKLGFTLEGHADRISSLAFSEDGKTLFSASRDGTVRLWEIETRKTKATLQPWTADRSVRLALSPDGKTVVVAGLRESIELWDLSTQKKIATIKADGDRIPDEQMAIAPGGKMLAFAGGAVVLLDPSNGTRTFIRGETRHFRAVAFSLDGKTLAVSDDDVPLLDLGTGTETTVIPAGSRWVRSIAFAPDGKTMALGLDGGLVRRREIGKDVAQPRGLPRQPLQVQTQEQVNRAAFQRYLEAAQGARQRNDLHEAIRSYGYAQALFPTDELVTKGLTEAKKALAERRWHAGYVQAVALAPDGKTLATGGEDKTVKIWDLNKRQVLFSMDGHTERVTSVAYSRDGTVLYSAGSDWTVRSWEAATGKAQKTVSPGKPNRGTYLTLSPDASKVAVHNGFGGTFEVWDIGCMRQLATVPSNRALLAECVALAPDGKRAVFVAGRVTVLDVEKQQWQTFQQDNGHVRAVAYSPDGKILAVSPDEVILWDPDTYEKRTVVPVRDRWVRSIGFSRDGKQMVVGLGDGLIKVCELAKPETFLVLGRD